MNGRIEDLNKDELLFLQSWEEIHKRGILTFWVLFYVSQAAYDAKTLYEMLAEHDTTLNEHSLYRLLRRLYDVGLIELTHSKGRNKFYTLAPKGHNILSVFITRNIDPFEKVIRRHS